MNGGSHLLDEVPLNVYRSLAVALGDVNQAIILQELHWLLNEKRLKNDHYAFIDGKWWVYNSYAEWQIAFFPWLSIPTLQRLFAELEDRQIVRSRQGVKNPMDRRKWYTIDYVRWEAFAAEMDGLTEYPKSNHASYQNDTKQPIKTTPSTVSKSDDDSLSGSPSALTSGSLSAAGANAPGGGEGGDPKAKPARPRNPWYDAIMDIWHYTAEMNGAMEKMLRGQATAKAWKMGNVAEPITPDDLRAWAAWYRKTELKGDTSLNMLEDRLKIASSIGYWYQSVRKPPPPETETKSDFDQLSPEEQAARRAAVARDFGWEG